MGRTRLDTAGHPGGLNSSAGHRGPSPKLEESGSDGHEPAERHRSPLTGIHPDAISPGESFLQLLNLSEPALVLSLKVSFVFQQSLSLHLERIFEKKKNKNHQKTGFNVSSGLTQHPSFPQHLTQCLTKGPRGWTNTAPGKTQCERDLYVHV